MLLITLVLCQYKLVFCTEICFWQILSIHILQMLNTNWIGPTLALETWHSTSRRIRPSWWMAESGRSSRLLRRRAYAIERGGRGRPQPEDWGSPSLLQGSEFRPEAVFWCPCNESTCLEDSKRTVGVIGSSTQWNWTEIRDPSCQTQIFGAQSK